MPKSAVNAEMRKLAKHFDQIMTAFHESGHTICGLLHAFKVDAVVIFERKKDKRIEGFTLYNDTQRHDNRWLNSELQVSYAGIAAEQILFQKLSGFNKLPLFLKEGSSDDIVSAGQLLHKHNVCPPGRKRLQFKKKIMATTSRQLTKYWDDVILVAHALLQNKCLYFQDLKHLLTKKSKNKRIWQTQFQKLCNNINWCP